MNNDTLFDYDKFNHIIIKYKGNKLSYGDFEKLLFNTLHKMKNAKEKKQVLISLEQELTFVFLIIYVSISEYLKNICSLDNNILNDIKPGDKVVKNGQLLIFNKLDEEYIYMSDKDECKIMLPIEKAYMLTKYIGNASRINKAPNGHNIAQEFLSDLLKIKKEEFIGNIKNSTIIVVESKEKLYDIINSIEIYFNKRKYNLSEIFPLAYYSSEENFEFFKGNKIKQNGLIKFMTNSSLALDLIRDDENINNVIFIGSDTYKNSIDVEIRQIEMYDSVEKIIMIDTWESNYDFTIFDNEFSIYAFTKKVILDNINLYNDNMCNYYSELQKYNNQLMFNIVNKEINIYQINNSEEFDVCIHNICINLKSLFDFSYDNVQILDFLKISYSLCNRFEQTIIPLKKSVENLNKVNFQLKNLVNIMVAFSEERSEYIIMKEIIDEFNSIIKLLNITNFKSDFILKQYTEKKQSMLMIKNKNEFMEAKYYYNKYPSYKINIEMFDKLKENINSENIIISFYADSKDINIITTNKVLNMSVLVYEREKYRINALIYKTIAMFKYIDNNNKLSEYENELLVINKYYKRNDVYNELLDNKEIVKIEKNVEKLIEENLLNIYLNKNKYSYNVNDYAGNKNIKKFVMFNDGNYAFLTTNYKANVLDKNNNDIVTKKLDQLKIDDNMIFTFNKVSGEEDIVKVILKKLLEIKQFKEKYEQHFRLNKLWKDELRKYMNAYNLTEENICTEFRLCSRIINKVTIMNWLNGNIVGPRDPNDIRIIAKIINNKSLNDQIDKVVEACQSERKIQVHVRKALAKIIINSVALIDNEESEIEKLIRNTIDDISRYAYIGKITLIKDVTENMNAQYVNRVIEREG